MPCHAMNSDREREREREEAHRALPVECVEWMICEMIIMRFYAPVFIFENMLVARRRRRFSFYLSRYIFSFAFLGSSGELVLIYLFLTFAIYIKQTTAHSMHKRRPFPVELDRRTLAQSVNLIFDRNDEYCKCIKRKRTQALRVVSSSSVNSFLRNKKCI